VRRMQQAQRRDAGLPFVDIMAEPASGAHGVPPPAGADYNAAAVAAVAGEAGLGMGPLGVGHSTGYSSARSHSHAHSQGVNEDEC
jgi:hypothetical protein